MTQRNLRRAHSTKISKFQNFNGRKFQKIYSLHQKSYNFFFFISFRFSYILLLFERFHRNRNWFYFILNLFIYFAIEPCDYKVLIFIAIFTLIFIIIFMMNFIMISITNLLIMIIIVINTVVTMTVPKIIVTMIFIEVFIVIEIVVMTFFLTFLSSIIFFYNFGLMINSFDLYVHSFCFT